jgi:hypothetical protein
MRGLALRLLCLCLATLPCRGLWDDEVRLGIQLHKEYNHPRARERIEIAAGLSNCLPLPDLTHCRESEHHDPEGSKWTSHGRSPRRCQRAVPAESCECGGAMARASTRWLLPPSTPSAGVQLNQPGRHPRPHTTLCLMCQVWQ